MDLGQLRYFNQIVEHRSFTKAAQACLVSQPALSQQIAKLEKELGQPLFERHGREIKLTRAGQILHDNADRILNLVDDAKRQIMDDGEHGRIAISAIPTIAPYLLPRVLQEIGAQFPLASLEVGEDIASHLMKRCGDGEIDIAFLSVMPVATKHLFVETLLTEELLLAIPEKHPLATRRKIVAKDLTGLPFLLLNKSHCLGDIVDNFFLSRQIQPNVIARIEQLETIKNLIARGFGASLIPNMATESDSSGRIAYRPLCGEKPVRKIMLCYNPERFQSQLVTNFLKALRELLDNGSDWYPSEKTRHKEHETQNEPLNDVAWSM